MQKICDVRIDERLIHGQVATFWKGQLNFNRIMVINDAAANDPMQKSLLKLSCPAETALSCLTLKKAAANLLAEKYQGQNVFIIVKEPKVLIELWNEGYHFAHITVGNMSKTPERTQVIKNISCDASEAEAFWKLFGLGIQIDYQNIPSIAAVDFMPLLEKAGFQAKR